MNDGGYGSEFHKLRADGIDDSLALFGRPALENIARGFGLRGHEIRDVVGDPRSCSPTSSRRAKAKYGTSRSRIRSPRRDPPDHQARARQYVTSGAVRFRAGLRSKAGIEQAPIQDTPKNSARRSARGRGDS